jgi:hypothetical protein
MINTAYIEHGDLPSVLTVQFDGASTNKCMLVLAFLGLYVLEGVFRTVRVRCLLESHAHDVYDAFHAVHAGLVRHSTFYHHEDRIRAGTWNTVINPMSLLQASGTGFERSCGPSSEQPTTGCIQSASCGL